MMTSDLPEPGFNAVIGGVVTATTAEHVVAVVPMIFNDRVLLMDASTWRIGPIAAFCYDKGGAAMLAALAWEPAEAREPAGHKKVAFDARDELGD